MQPATIIDIFVYWLVTIQNIIFQVSNWVRNYATSRESQLYFWECSMYLERLEGRGIARQVQKWRHITEANALLAALPVDLEELQNFQYQFVASRHELKNTNKGIEIEIFLKDIGEVSINFRQSKLEDILSVLLIIIQKF